MRIRSLQMFVVVVMFQAFGVGLYAQKRTEDPPLNKIKIGTCNSANLTTLIEKERKRGLVIDARPFAINQSTGKLLFNGETGRVTVVHMNPFLYQYKISVGQQELISSAVTDFLDILLPPGLRIGKEAQAADKNNMKAAARLVQTASSSGPVATRLGNFDPTKCPNNDVCEALTTMNDEFIDIEHLLASAKLDTTIVAPTEYPAFKQNLITLREEESDASTTCTNAGTLYSGLSAWNADNYLQGLDKARKYIKEIHLLANDLSALADRYLKDNDLKMKNVVRCGGFGCAGEFKAYAEAVNGLLDIYDHELDDLIAVGEFMKKMQDLTDPAKAKEGLFARTFEIIKKYELSEATVSIARTKIETKSESTKQETDDENNNNQSRNHALLSPTASIGDRGPKDDQKGSDEKEKDDKGSKSQKGNSLTADINESIQIGRPRFLLSGGLVFSPLRRQTFDSVKGFVRDANGNPTGDGSKNVVGFGENSPRRLMPMVMLNTRLTNFDPTSVYFSLGVTAKHDDNVDVEYLLGPSISLLNERALFTFGGYVGKVQKLVPDLKIGDEIPDTVGDAKLFTKRYSWKPGFSFTYVFSQNQRSGEGSSTDDGNGGGGDVKNEIRIGGIPFNLAMGLAYTSLEERTYDEIVGYARDRDGNVTNGQNLTRIVGLTSSSGYRLAPLALLHTRLFDFGNRSFYFSTGVTGKKSDDKLEIEYLLGGTVNAYRRKIFVTFGAFAGKQAVLGGDFFLGAKLDKDQNVTTSTRYVWKPGFAISYDISRI